MNEHKDFAGTLDESLGNRYNTIYPGLFVSAMIGFAGDF